MTTNAPPPAELKLKFRLCINFVSYIKIFIYYRQKYRKETNSEFGQK